MQLKPTQINSINKKSFHKQAQSMSKELMQLPSFPTQISTQLKSNATTMSQLSNQSVQNIHNKSQKQKNIIKRTIKNNQLQKYEFKSFQNDDNDIYSSDDCAVADEIDRIGNKLSGSSKQQLNMNKSPINQSKCSLHTQKQNILKSQDYKRSNTSLTFKYHQKPLDSNRLISHPNIENGVAQTSRNYQPVTNESLVNGIKPIMQSNIQKLREMNFDELLQYTDSNYIQKDNRCHTTMNLPKDSVIKKSPINSIVHLNDISMGIKQVQNKAQQLKQNGLHNYKQQPQPGMRVDKAAMPLSQVKANTKRPMTQLLQSQDMCSMKRLLNPQQAVQQAVRTKGSPVHDRLFQHSEQWNKQRNEWNPPKYDEDEVRMSCTFQPDLSKSPMQFLKCSSPSNAHSSQKRSFKQFLQDQTIFEQHKEKKLADLQKENIVEEMRQQQINYRSKSNESYESSIKEFHSRTKMFESKREDRIKQMKSQQDKQMTFKPQISQKSQRLVYEGMFKEVGERLYKLQKEIDNDQQPSIDKFKQQSNTQKVNKNSVKYVCQGLEQDYDLSIKKIECQDILKKDQYHQIMDNLGYSFKANEFKDVGVSINSIWNILCNGQKQILVKNVKVILFAMEGACYSWMIKPTGSVKQKVQECRIGSFLDERFYLKNAEEAELISKKYIMLLLNRRRMMDEIRKEQANQKKQESIKKSEQKKSFNSKKSLEILSTTDRVNNSKSFEDQLLQKGELYKQRLEIRKKQIDELEVFPCTFHPEINNNYVNYEEGKLIRKTFSKSPDSSRFLTLYNQQNSVRNDSLRSPMDIEFDQQKEECSFAPKICQKSRELVSMKSQISHQEQESNKSTRKQRKQAGVQPIGSGKGSPQHSFCKSPLEQSRLKSPKILHRTKGDLQGYSNIMSKFKRSRTRNRSTGDKNLCSKTEPNINKMMNSGINKRVYKSTTGLKDLSKSVQDLKQQPFGNPQEQYLNTEDNITTPLRRDIDKSKGMNFQNYKDKPVIFIDVNLGGSKVQRILIQEGDSIEFVVEQFASAFKLNLKKKMKLYQVIHAQLEGYLPCIEEEDQGALD